VSTFFLVLGFALFPLGVALVGIVAFVTFMRRHGDPAMDGLAGTTQTPIARTAGGKARFRGRVVAPPEGALRDPMSGRAAAWYRVEGFRAAARSSERSLSWSEAFTLRDARDFGIDDGSGEIVRVVADEAKYLVPMNLFGGVQAAFAPDGLPWTRHELTPEMESFIRTQGGIGEGTPIKAHGWLVAPGSTVTVVGFLDRSSGAPVLRDRAPQSPLVVYGIDEATLQEDRRVRRRNRLILVVVGTAMALLGLLCFALSMALSFTVSIN
jgi:hypothetical protein